MNNATKKLQTSLRKNSRPLSDHRDNRVRRERYKKDVKYRGIKRRAAAQYAVNTRMNDPETVAYRVRLRVLLNGGKIKLAALGTQRLLYVRGGTRGPMVMSFTHAELAVILERDAATVSQWHTQGFFLEPQLMVCASRGGGFSAYTLQQVSRIVAAVAEIVAGPKGHLRQAYKTRMRSLQMG